jgi:hypothetical protein
MGLFLLNHATVKFIPVLTNIVWWWFRIGTPFMLTLITIIVIMYNILAHQKYCNTINQWTANSKPQRIAHRFHCNHTCPNTSNCKTLLYIYIILRTESIPTPTATYRLTNSLVRWNPWLGQAIMFVTSDVIYVLRLHGDSTRLSVLGHKCYRINPMMEMELVSQTMEFIHHFTRLSAPEHCIYWRHSLPSTVLTNHSTPHKAFRKLLRDDVSSVNRLGGW